MEMIYRGVRYQQPIETIQVADAPMVGQYRGATFRLHKAPKVSILQPILHLIYRGVHFDEGIEVPIG